MTLDEMIVDIRREINQPAADGFLTNHEIAAFINRGQDAIATRIMEMDQNFFDESDQTLGFVANQEEYDLPARLQNRKLTLVKRTDINPPEGEIIDYMPFQDAKRLYGVSAPVADPAVYYLRNQKIGIKPTPRTTVPLNLLINYLMLPHELHWAQAKTPTSNTFNIPTALTGAAPLLKAGRASTQGSYYVGAKIRILTGTEKGNEYTITQYNADTGLIGINPANFTSGGSNILNQDYVILSPIPAEHHNLLYQLGLMKCAKKAKDMAAYQTAKEEVGAAWSLLDTLISRHQDGPRHVALPDDFED